MTPEPGEDLEFSAAPPAPKRDRRSWPAGPEAAFTANLIVTVVNLQLLSVPPGSRARPMFQALIVFAMGGIGLVAAIAALCGLARWKRKWLVVLTILLGLSPIPLGIFEIGLIVKLMHLQLAE